MDSKPAKAYLFEIAGVQHAQYKDAIANGLCEAMRLDLRLEPENQYDNEAVRIEWNGYKLGYIPKKQEELKKLLHKEGELEHYICTLSFLNEDANPWQMFTVLIEEVVEA